MVPLVYINSEERTIFECVEILQGMQVPGEFIDKYIKNMEFINSVHVQRQASTEEHFNDIITILTMCKKKTQRTGMETNHGNGNGRSKRIEKKIQKNKRNERKDRDAARSREKRNRV